MTDAGARTKHDVLTEAEMRAFRMDERFLGQLREHADRTGRRPSALRVLDWGCGRGRSVAALLAEGYDAVGIDVDPEPLANGRDLLRARGHDPDARLRLWDPRAPVPLPDASCDAILSDQMWEHVGPLDRVAAEMARLLRPDGFGLHLFPAWRRVVEPHLLMPLVHWLPKGRLRRWWIRGCVAYGVEPRPVWPELRGADPEERARTYHAYSVERTHYRPPRALRRALLRHGLSARFWGSGGSSRALQLALGAARRWPPLRAPVDWWRRTLHSTWMRVEPAAAEPRPEERP